MSVEHVELAAPTRAGVSYQKAGWVWLHWLLASDRRDRAGQPRVPVTVGEEVHQLAVVGTVRETVEKPGCPGELAVWVPGGLLGGRERVERAVQGADGRWHLEFRGRRA